MSQETQEKGFSTFVASNYGHHCHNCMFNTVLSENIFESIEIHFELFFVGSDNFHLSNLNCGFKIKIMSIN